MRIGKNELEILKYMERWDLHRYKSIQRGINLDGLDGYSDAFVRKRARARYLEWSADMGGYKGVYEWLRKFYDGKTLTSRVLFSQALHRLIKKGLVKVEWEIDLSNMCDLLGPKEWDKQLFYSDTERGITERKHYVLTDAGRNELNKRRRRLE